MTMAGVLLPADWETGNGLPRGEKRERDHHVSIIVFIFNIPEG